ncbi:MAG: HlyD family efflux transporter periplasmic adaptor subunit [Hyphomicrobiaceae bacterium]
MSEAIPRQVIALSRLAQVELELREAESVEAVLYIAANDIHRVVPYGHAVVWRADKDRIGVVSGGLAVDPTQPDMIAFRDLMGWLARASAGAIAGPVDVASLPPRLGLVAGRLGLRNPLWLPMRGAWGHLAGGLILLRDEPFQDGEIRILSRLAGAAGHALTGLGGRPPRTSSRSRRRAIAALLLLAGTGALMIPVPLNVLAEARVVPVEPAIVTASIDGVVGDIPVSPNESVRAGDIVVVLDRRELASAREIAEKRVEILSAERDRLLQKAFADDEARAGLALAATRLAEGQSELALAEDRLSRTEVRARSDGIALIEDRSAWIGRPVRVGERILAIAEPSRARIDIELSAEDVLVAEPGATVDLFLAVAPDHAVSGRLTRISYDARMLAGGRTAFIAEAAFAAAAELPRLGLTGTARISGPMRPLVYVLLRKPLSRLRRVLGM